MELPVFGGPKTDEREQVSYLRLKCYEIELGQSDYDSKDFADSAICQLYVEDK